MLQLYIFTSFSFKPFANVLNSNRITIFQTEYIVTHYRQTFTHFRSDTNKNKY